MLLMKLNQNIYGTSEAYEIASRNGNNQAILLIKKENPHIQISDDAFIEALKYNKFDTFLFLLDNFSDFRINHYIYYKIIDTKKLDFISTIISKCPYINEHNKSINFSLFNLYAGHGHIELIDLINTKYKNLYDGNRSIIECCIQNNQFETLLYLKKNNPDLCDGDCPFIIENIVEKGNLKLLKFIKKEFPNITTTKQAYINAIKILRDSILKDILMFFKENYSYIKHMTNQKSESSFGHCHVFDICQWLKHFTLTQ